MFLHVGENPKQITKFLLYYHLDSKCSFLGKLSNSRADQAKSD